ncbi:hypothetical protein A8L44_07205 [Bacillus sp. FJAT-27986]|nr:hypothetical protein A8L44_07205 [Bacillus sp. FJAT-27986]
MELILRHFYKNELTQLLPIWKITHSVAIATEGQAPNESIPEEEAIKTVHINRGIEENRIK